MKFRIAAITLSLLFYAGFTTAQIDPDEVEPDESPYPLVNQAPSEEAEAFIALFNDETVGNMHVYSSLDTESDYNYLYKGVEITPEYYSLFDGETLQLLAPSDNKAYAVRSIRGEEQTYFIMRMPSAYDDNNSNVMLFELRGEYLESKELLAFAYEQDGVVYQQDSWIRDIDGDTLLDIIKKYQQKDEDGDVVAETFIVKRQLPSGAFVRTDEFDLDESDYRMEPLMQ